jgi:EAL domain-containing protein (putative c-di-GMP-specific phosphodiesterase class I)
MARTLKIDRSFVTDIHEYRTDHAIVQAVLVMAERLGIRVVAEGVETKDQLSALVELGCRFLQGYFFSPPISADDIMSFDPEVVRVHGLALGVGGAPGDFVNPDS